MSLLWIPVHSIAKWTAPPAPPRVVRAAIPGQGWLVATEVTGGWSTTFVPDPGAADPPDEWVAGGFQAAKVDWSAATEPHTHGAKPHAHEDKDARPADKKTTKTSR